MEGGLPYTQPQPSGPERRRMEIVQLCLKTRAEPNSPGHKINHITPPKAKGAHVTFDERVRAVQGHELATWAAASGFASNGAGRTLSTSASPAAPQEPHSEILPY